MWGTLNLRGGGRKHRPTKRLKFFSDHFTPRSRCLGTIVWQLFFHWPPRGGLYPSFVKGNFSSAELDGV